MFKEREEYEEIEVVDGASARKMTLGWVIIPAVLISFGALYLVGSAFGGVRGLFSERITAHQNGATIVVYVPENFQMGEANATILAGLAGYSTVVYAHCDDLDTSMAFGMHQEPGVVFLIDEKAHANGTDCLAHIAARYKTAYPKVVCLAERSGSATFRQICTAATYTVVDKDTFFQTLDGKLHAQSVIEMIKKLSP